MLLILLKWVVLLVLITKYWSRIYEMCQMKLKHCRSNIKLISRQLIKNLHSRYSSWKISKFTSDWNTKLLIKNIVYFYGIYYIILILCRLYILYENMINLCYLVLMYIMYVLVLVVLPVPRLIQISYVKESLVYLNEKHFLNSHSQIFKQFIF